MDMITLAMAKAYSDSKGGYVEPGKVLTYKNGMTDVLYDVYAKATDEVMDLTKVKKAVYNFGEDTIEFTEFTVETTSESNIRIDRLLVDAEAIAVCIHETVGDMQKGTYVLGDCILAYIEFAETIVPIDQKYLPGVCLPVLELSQQTMTAIFTSGSATATAEEANAIISAKNAITPLAVKGDLNGMVFAITANLSSDGISAGYTADFGGMKLYFEVSDTSVSISTLA